MMLLILILIMTATSFTAFSAMNPLSMGLLILFMALTLSVTFALSMSSWVALLIFLLYIGGMLVMFSYFIAITPNQSFPMPLLLSVMLGSFFSLMIMSYSTNLTPNINISYLSQMNIMYESYNIGMLVMLAMILLFTMVVVVKISSVNIGPLRPFFKYV